MQINAAKRMRAAAMEKAEVRAMHPTGLVADTSIICTCRLRHAAYLFAAHYGAVLVTGYVMSACRILPLTGVLARAG